MKRKITMVIILLLIATACKGSYLNNISLNDLNNKLEEKETFVLYLTDESDEGKVLKKTLSKVSEDNNIKTYYLKTNKLNDDDSKKLNNLFTYENTNIIIFVKEGKEESVLSRIDNIYISQKKLKEEFKIQGYIK